jgi:hypothetical protein
VTGLSSCAKYAPTNMAYVVAVLSLQAKVGLSCGLMEEHVCCVLQHVALIPAHIQHTFRVATSFNELLTMAIFSVHQ